MLESKLSAQSEVLRALNQVFVKDFSLFIKPSTLTSLPVPAAEPPTNKLLPPPSFTEVWNFLPPPHSITGAQPEWPLGSWTGLLPRSLPFISASYPQRGLHSEWGNP